MAEAGPTPRYRPDQPHLTSDPEGITVRHNRPARLLPPRTLLTAACVVAAVTEVGVLLAAARHGFDFTDEGYYLNAISHDAQGAVLTSESGWVYRVLAFPFTGDVAAMRWLNVTTFLLVGAMLGWTVACRRVGEGPPDRSMATATVAGLGAASLGFFGTGLLTPSYNSLAATGAMLVASGLVIASQDQATKARVRAATGLVAIGGLLAFLGKPSSGVATGVVAGVALLTWGPVGRRVAGGASVTAATGLVVLSLLRTGTPLGIPVEMFRGVHEARTLQAGHDLSSALTAFGLPQTSPHAVLLFVALAVMSFVWARGGAVAGHRLPWLLLALVTTAAVASLLMSQPRDVSFFVPTRSLVILGAPAGLLVAALTSRDRPDRRSVILALALLLLPHAWIFGSNNDYWHGASLLSVLWFAGALVLMPDGTRRAAAAPASHTAVPMLLLTGVVLVAVLNNPYRQAVPLRAQQTPVRIGPYSTLEVAPDVARAIAGFREAARTQGFTPGTPILDLTGQMPGLVFALEGRAVGAPWIIGGYPGSDAVARRTLSRTPCSTLAHAWLILEPEGTRRIDPEVLTAAGARPEEWTPVAREAISTVPSQERHIVLLRPSAAPQRVQAACEAGR